MSLKSVYIPEPSIENNQIRITGDEHRHLVVGRAEADEAVEVFDGKGNVWAAEIVSVGKREAIVRVTGTRHVVRDPHEVILGMALVRTAAFEVALEKAVEVGVTRIVPFTAARSNVSGGDRTDRWMRVLVEAAKQSKRYHVPMLDAPVSFEEMLSFDARSKIVFAERDGASLKSSLAGSPVLYLVGPEGGWTDAEFEEARRHGFHLVHLGSGILRAETAAIVGGALIRYELENQ